MRPWISLSLVVLLLAGSGALLWWITRAVSGFMVTSQAASVKLLDQMELACPPGARRIARPWGKAGWMVSCERNGRGHGPWLSAEGGRLQVRGSYWNGARDGVWEWYNDDGTVAKRLSYEGRGGGAPDANVRELTSTPQDAAPSMLD